MATLEEVFTRYGYHRLNIILLCSNDTIQHLGTFVKPRKKERSIRSFSVFIFHTADEITMLQAHFPERRLFRSVFLQIV